MWNLKACAVCLSTEGKLLDMDSRGQREDFNYMARLNSYGGDGLLSYLCVECSAYVKRFKKFQTRCQRANNLLQEMLDRKEQINDFDISSINREKLDLLPSLAYWKTDSCHYEEVEFQWVDTNKINTNKYSDVPIFFTSIIENFDVTPKSELVFDEHLDNDKEKIKTDTVTNYVEVEIEVTEIDNKSQNNIYEVSSSHEDDFQDDVVNCDRDTVEAAPTELATGVGGSTFYKQYANFYPLSDNQQKVVAEITKQFSNRPYKCSTCSKGYSKKELLEKHMKHHEKYLHGLLFCEFCQYYFKSKLLFNSHMSDKHLYKYVCTKCPEVSYDRLSAKVHYLKKHVQKDPKNLFTWHDLERGWIRSAKRTKAVSTIKGTKEIKKKSSIPAKPKIKLPENYFVRTPLGHLEQYEVINERQKSKTYIEARLKCELCYKGYNEVATFNNHLKKHNPNLSGPYMCDVCKLYFKDTRRLYSHISSVHQFRYNCQKCQFVCYGGCSARVHYKWHENITFCCPHCDMKFIKQSSQLSHIRIKHPSTNICNICGHSFINDAGLNCHMLKSHSKKEIELSEQLSQQVSEEGELYCGDCKMHFASTKAFQNHLGSSNKHTAVNKSVHSVKRTPKEQKSSSVPRIRPPRIRPPRIRIRSKVARTKQFTPIDCEKCGKHLTNKVKARQHYDIVHPSTDSLHLCDICGFSTKIYPNLVSHLRTHTKEQPFACKYCEKRFTVATNRDRHHLIHTGEKPYECPHCHRRFTQSSSRKLHIQTVHLKIPYAPWNKKNRKRQPKAEPGDSPSKANVHVAKNEEYLDAFILYQNGDEEEEEASK